MLPDLAEKTRRGEPLPSPLAALLTMATPLVRLGMWVRLRQPRTRVSARVISVGNITVGGTGKTPLVIERARTELATGRKVAILTRGYGSGARGPAAVVAGNQDARKLASVLGDEPALIARKVPGVVIVKDADRVAGAKRAISDFACDTLILDDGFQYVQLERDENIVLIDATNPFGNSRLLPRGILREPLGALSRATHIVLTRCDQAADLRGLVERLEELCPGVPIRQTRHAPVSLWRVADGATLGLDTIRGEEVRALCAIGNPEAFFATLKGLGARVIERRAYPDHCYYTDDMIPASGIVVTTEKDAMRITNPASHVLALGIDLEDIEEDAA